MNSMKVNLTSLVVGLYLILPVFFRIGPVSVYCLVILAVCLYAALTGAVKVPSYAITNTGWNIRLVLLMLPMLYHRELVAIIVYFVAPILLFFLLMHSVRTGRRIDELLDVLIGCSVINIVVCAVELLTGSNLSYVLCTDGTATYSALYRYGILRVAGAFVNAINNGLFCMMISAVVLYRIYSGELSTKKRRRYWVIWGANLAVIVLTSSRAALLAAAAVNLLIFWMAGKLRLSAKKLLLWLIAAMGILLLVLIPNPIGEKLGETLITILKLADELFGTSFVSGAFNQADVAGVGNRIELFSWVLDDVGSNYVWGKGRASQFSYVINEWGHTKESIENQYLYEFYKYGLIGLCGKLMLFASLLISKFKGMRAERRAGVKLGLNAVLFAVYLMYFISLLTVAQNEEKKLFYLLVVLGEIYTRNKFYLKEERAVSGVKGFCL